MTEVVDPGAVPNPPVQGWASPHPHPVATLARIALEHYVKTGLELDFSAGAPHEGTAPWRLPPDLPARAGVFVTLHLGGQLRGCMGHTAPSEPTLALEVVRTAIQAGTGDPRFQPVEEEDLPRLAYTVDVIEPPEERNGAELKHHADPGPGLSRLRVHRFQ